MSAKMQLTAKLQQRLVMNQQLQQAITLLQYNTIELKQLVQQFIETNPLLELEEEIAESQSDDEYVDDSEQIYSASLARKNLNQDDESSLENYANPKSLREHLLEQTLLCRFDYVQQIIAISIIDAIDDVGRLTMSIEDIQTTLIDMGPPHIDTICHVLTMIQKFDPIGIAARDLRECLLIQLQNISVRDATWSIANEILLNHYAMIATNNADKITKKLGIDHQLYAQAINLIRTFNPNPGLQYSSEVNINIEPELYVKKVKDNWQVFLTDSLLTNLKINNYYQELIKKSKKHASFESMNKELQEAQWLLKGIKRRNETLLAVATHIVKLQKDFLDQGHAFMKPLIIADVSTALNLHESTVSRITNGKYISTPWGVFELKFFFPSHVTTQSGHHCSETAVKAYIKEIIGQESNGNIFSDGDIAERLKEKGINIARRTVAKYREAMKILPSYQRAHIHSHHAKLEELEPA